MKWFRHMSTASSDEFIAEIEEEFGLEGYARWWKLLESVASQMDKTDKCSVGYSWVKWQQILRGKRNKLETFLERLENKQKIKVKQNGNILEIECRKLLELRDEYSRKSGQAPDTCQDKVAPDTDTEEERVIETLPSKEIMSEKVNEKQKNPEKTTKGQKPSEYTEEFLAFWGRYPRTAGSKKTAFDSWLRAIRNELPERIIASVEPYQRYCQRTQTPHAHPSTWLNQRRWETDYDTLTEPARRGTPGRDRESAHDIAGKAWAAVAGGDTGDGGV